MSAVHVLCFSDAGLVKSRRQLPLSTIGMWLDGSTLFELCQCNRMVGDSPTDCAGHDGGGGVVGRTTGEIRIDVDRLIQR